MIINKIFLLAAATILLAGCTKNEIAVSTENSREISFAAYSGREATKAGTTTDLQTGSFQVTAEYKKNSMTSTYFTNEKFSWNTDKFTSTTTHYWPVDGGTLTFYATMPDKYSGTSTEIVPADTVDFTADGVTDFKAACLKDKTSSNTDSLAFNHKLTKVSFTAKGQNTNLKYVISSVKLAANSVARYAMVTSESWTSAATSKEYTVLGTDSTLVAGTTTAKAIGTAQLLIPNQPSTANTVKLTVKYKVYDGESLVDDYSSGVDVDLTASSADWGVNKSFRYNLTLGVSSSVSPITFNAEQTDWGTEKDTTINVTPPALTPVLLSGEFSVSANKTVKFTKGNLYWNGSAWKLEANQYDYRHRYGLTNDIAVINGTSTTTPSGTVGSFYWTKTAAAAYADSYGDGTCTESDVFFCDGSDASHILTIDGQSGLYALSNDEWNYLLKKRTDYANLNKVNVTVAGVTCMIFAPDGYTETIASSYSAAEWIAAEADGLVCLPLTGMYQNNAVRYSGSNANYLESDPWYSGGTKAYAFQIDKYDGPKASGSANREDGNPIRLVYSAQ